MQLPYVPYAAGQRNHVKYIEVLQMLMVYQTLL